MTRPGNLNDRRNAQMTGEPQEPARTPDNVTGPVPEVIFDPELFEELRDSVGSPRLRLALEELAATLLDTFAETSPQSLDPNQTFQTAHFLTARAGMMGFTALRRACSDLQHACASQVPFNAEYARTRAISVESQKVISVLLRHPL